VPVSFGATYGSFDTKRREVFRQYNYNYNSEYAQASLEITFSTNSTSAYRACLDALTYLGVHMYAVDLNSDGVTILLRYRAPPKLIGDLDVDVEVSNPTSKSLTKLTVTMNGERRFSLARQSSSTRIIANGGGYSASLLIPPPPPPEPPQQPTFVYYQSKNTEMAACNDNTANGYYWHVARKLQNWGISGPSATNPTIASCDASHLGEQAMTYRFPHSHDRYQAVAKAYQAYNGGSGGDPECVHYGDGVNPSILWNVPPQGYHCGVFQAECRTQP
jgi:hypothetical protein